MCTARDFVSETDLDDSALHSSDLSNEEFRDFLWSCCALRDVNLIGSRFVRGKLWDVSFENCDLSGVSFDDVKLERVEFIDCKLDGLTAPGVRASDVRIERCRARDIWFRAAELRRVRFEASELPGAEFGASQLDDISFPDCDLSRADLSNAQTNRVSFVGASVEGAVGLSRLTGITISEDQFHQIGEQLLAVHGIRVSRAAHR